MALPSLAVPAASSACMRYDPKSVVEFPLGTPMKGFVPSKATPNPRLYHMTAEMHVSNKFFSKMCCVARAVTDPASSMPKPHCMKNTCGNCCDVLVVCAGS